MDTTGALYTLKTIDSALRWWRGKGKTYGRYGAEVEMHRYARF